MASHITITPASGRYVIRAGGAVIGETSNALELREGSYPPTIYVPRDDVAMAFLDRSDRETSCPHKGVASYYSVVLPTGRVDNAIWTYESPKDDVADIAGYLAFYTDRVTVERA
jgi:uncharacterized protein (DUF427 family)